MEDGRAGSDAVSKSGQDIKAYKNPHETMKGVLCSLNIVIDSEKFIEIKILHLSTEQENKIQNSAQNVFD